MPKNNTRKYFSNKHLQSIMITYLIINKHKLSIIVSVINTNKLKNYNFFLYKPRCHVSKVYDLTQGRQFHDMFKVVPFHLSKSDGSVRYDNSQSDSSHPMLYCVTDLPSLPRSHYIWLFYRKEWYLPSPLT